MKLFTLITPGLATMISESQPPWKIPSQWVQGRSGGFGNVHN